MKKPHSVPVGVFAEHANELSSLKLVCGNKGLKRPIYEPTLNRPGFALMGYMQHFAHRRVQVFGMAETSYLKSLSAKERKECYTRFFDPQYSIPCVVFCRRLRPEVNFLIAAEKANIPVFRSDLITMRFINQATHTLDELFAPHQLEIGCMVDILGVGVLIKGKSGIGKSECVLSLIERGHSLVSDDVTELMVADGRELIGSSTKELQDFMEVRGIGIINIAEMFGIKSIRNRKRIDMVVTLCPLEDTEEIDRLGNETKTIEIMGVKLPHLTLPVSAGRDTGRLVEVAAFEMKLQIAGHTSGMEQYSDRIRKKMLNAMKRKRGRSTLSTHPHKGKIEK